MHVENESLRVWKEGRKSEQTSSVKCVVSVCVSCNFICL